MKETSTFDEEFGFLPPNLVFKCDAFVRAYHDRNGSGWNFVKPQLLSSHQSPYLERIERICLSQFRIFQFAIVVGIVALFIAIVWSYWLLLVTLAAAMCAIKMARNLKFNLVQIRALILSNEMLAVNFAGWGDGFPDAATKATQWLARREQDGESLFDTYLPPNERSKFAEAFMPPRI